MEYKNWGQRAGRLLGSDTTRQEDLETTLPLRGERGTHHAETVPTQGRQPALAQISRRVLFVAGGLTLVGGCGVTTAETLAGAAPSSPGARRSRVASPSRSPTPSPRESSPSAPPADLSSSSGSPTPPPPDVPNPGSGVNASAVQAAPEYYVHAGPKVIALTLDDGPNAIYTPKILALLATYHVTATFCMIGRQIAANSGLVREVVAAGHGIANHTWDHADQSKLSVAAIRSEISRGNDALAAVGARPQTFRAPYGAWSPAVFEACAATGLRPLGWSVDPRDWSRPGTSTIISRIMSATRTGSIILDHDGGGDRSETVDALTVVIPELLAAGYRFTTV